MRNTGYMMKSSTRFMVIIYFTIVLVLYLGYQVYGDNNNVSDSVCVVYSLHIVDLIKTTDLDQEFSKVTYAENGVGSSQSVITADQLSFAGNLWQYAVHSQTGGSSLSLRAQSWLTVYPGKTTTLSIVHHYLGYDPTTDQSFFVQITPTMVDRLTGSVTSLISFKNSININPSMVDGSSEAAPESIVKVKQAGAVSTTVHTKPATPELLAVVRRTMRMNQKQLMGVYNGSETRDFALYITTRLVSVDQLIRDTQSGIMGVADLNGFNQLIDSGPEEPSLPQNLSQLEIGATLNQNNRVDGWFQLTVPFGPESVLKVAYENPARYFTSITQSIDGFDGIAVELMAGAGTGPRDTAALILGVGEQKRIGKSGSLFAVYYPLAYLLDQKQLSFESVWQTGIRLDVKNFGFIISGSGNPNFNGYKFKLTYAIKPLVR